MAVSLLPSSKALLLIVAPVDEIITVDLTVDAVTVAVPVRVKSALTVQVLSVAA